jgi:hypothetical protein
VSLARAYRLAALVGGLVWIVNGLLRLAGAAYWNPHTLADYTAMASYSLGLLGLVGRRGRRHRAGEPAAVARSAANAACPGDDVPG